MFLDFVVFLNDVLVVSLGFLLPNTWSKIWPKTLSKPWHTSHQQLDKISKHISLTYLKSDLHPPKAENVKQSIVWFYWICAAKNEFLMFCIILWNPTSLLNTSNSMFFAQRAQLLQRILMRKPKKRNKRLKTIHDVYMQNVTKRHV